MLVVRVVAVVVVIVIVFGRLRTSVQARGRGAGLHGLVDLGRNDRRADGGVDTESEGIRV